VEAFTKSASHREVEGATLDLMLVGIAIHKAGKARRGVSLPVHREDEGELIDRAVETNPKLLGC